MIVQHLMCRDEGHLFERAHDHDVLIDSKGELVSYQRTSTCGCCYTVRLQFIDGRTFEVVRTSYKYPEGYLMKDGERMTRRQARKAVFQHFYEGAR